METVGLQLLQPRLYESPIFLEPTLVRPSRNGAIFVAISDPEVLDCPTCCETLTIPVFQSYAFISFEIRVEGCYHLTSFGLGAGNLTIEPGTSWEMVVVLLQRIMKFEVVSNIVKEKLKFELLGIRQSFLSAKKIALSKKLQHKCPSCAMPIGDNRCRAIEKVLESLKVQCSNWRSDTLGHVITVSCMGLSSSKPGYFYELMTRAEGSNIRFQSSTRNVQTRVDDPPSLGCLLVPNDFLGTCGQITLDVCIWRLGSYPAISSVRACPRIKDCSINVSWLTQMSPQQFL
ncbi:hypothetical protein POTOM_017091 [Populus tomentosa]|uniref:Uncharacterized protein n=1 Tax=Populus tomentosa TaxID=118781 RepID=A0A8X8D6A0_POPTO|nr:hypothetical protein POTOM_017091 [Populus tomentosa]